MHIPAAPSGLTDWPLDLIAERFSTSHHGDFSRWAEALENLPELAHAAVDYGATVSVTGEVDDAALETALQMLHPWRKGPFKIGNVYIDTEWRSDWKWQRLNRVLPVMTGERVLDVGCGNGYFGWRMLEQGAAEVVGIDPTLLFCMQHLAISHYTQDPRNWVLPLKIEDVPTTTQFDSVFSMGVIYHRRDPLAHVQQLAQLTRPGGRVVLESLVVADADPLRPPGRYARMRNVWCVPRVNDLRAWMQAAGLSNLITVDVTPTSLDEQRSTAWMRFESLAQSLDPTDPSRTVEGHPAPLRAIVVGIKPQ